MSVKTRQTQVGRGNTKTDPTEKKVLKRNRQYTFTLNNYSKHDISSIEEWLKGRKHMTYVFQEETGENGTPHLQGCFKSKDPIEFELVKKMIPKGHIEVCKCWNKSFEYCCKQDTRTGKVYSNEMGIVERCQPIDNYFDMKIATKWQLEILELIEKRPDPRKIYWIYDDPGDSGKSYLCKHIVLNHPRQSILVSGKGADIKYTIKTFLDNKKNNLKIVMLDVPRSCLKYVSYTAIEEIKNGLFCSNKYESGMCVMNCVHVVIFANEEPDYKEMSLDRWIVWDISDKTKEYKVLNTKDRMKTLELIDD